MKKWLVTGGCGFIGSSVVRALLARGDAVVIFDDNSRSNWKRLADVMNKLDMRFGDIRYQHSLLQAIRGCDAVIHLAAVNGTENFYKNPGKVLEVGVKGILHVMDACVAEGIQELYAASSSEVYQNAWQVPTKEDVPLIVPDPYNPRYSYGASKILTEMFCLHYATDFFRRVIVFRPHNVYGPDAGEDHVIPQLIRRALAWRGGNLFEIEGTGDETRAFCHIDDAVRGIMTLIDKGQHGEIYNVGIDEEISIRKLANLIGKMTATGDCTPNGATKLGSAKRRCPDVTKLRELGWVPKVSLQDGLAQTVQWYTDNPVEKKV
jgi:nucleoside-diphosphate-sugar epimerase